MAPAVGRVRDWRSRWLLGALVMLLIGCDAGVLEGRGGDSGAPDGSARFDGAVDGVVIDPPAAPAPPSFMVDGRCPMGWTAVEEEGLTRCEPFDEGGPRDCPAGQAHFPGTAGCALLSPCPTGDFADDLPAGRPVLYVHADAFTGDGSRARPFGRLSQIPAGRLVSGTVIALSAGMHEGSILLPAGVALWGACAANTVLRSSTAAALLPTIEVVGAGVEVRNLRIADSERWGIGSAASGTSMHVVAVEIDRVLAAGILLDGDIEMRAERLVVRRTRRVDGEESYGRGMSLQNGVSVDVRTAAFEHNRAVGIFLNNRGSTLRLEDAVVRDTYADEGSRSNGDGMVLREGVQATLVRSLLERNVRTGVAVLGAADLELEDVLVRDTQSDPATGVEGRGLEVEFGGTVRGRRVVLSGNDGLGVLLAWEGTAVDFSDLLVRDLGTGPTGYAGAGLVVQTGASLVVRRAVVAHVEGLGVTVADANSRAELEDMHIHDVVADASGTLGRAFNVQSGAHLEIRRARVERVTDVGIMAFSATLAVEDVQILDTRSQPSDGRFGHGIQAQSGASVEGTRVDLQGSHGVSLASVDEGTSVELTHVHLGRTLPVACASDTCADTPYGVGAIALDNSSLSLRSFAIHDSSLCGVMLAGERTVVRLAGGGVWANPIGACVQVDGYDLSLLQDDVTYRDNAENLQATRLPVPEGADPLRVSR